MGMQIPCGVCAKVQKKVLYGRKVAFLKRIFHELARQKECEIVGGNLVQDHVHMIISIPPKYAISDIIGYLKGKSAIAMAREFGGKKWNFNGECFWARGYAVSTVGFELDKVRSYVKNQERIDGQGAEKNGKF